MQNEQLNSAETQHQIYLNRLAVGSANQVNPILEDFGRWVRKKLNAQGTTIETKKALNALLADVNKRYTKDLNKYSKMLNSDLDTLAGYEAGFQSELLSTTVKLETDVPSTAQVVSAASNNPLVIGASGGAVNYDTMLKNFTPTEVKRATGIISGGFYQGQTTNQITANLLGQLNTTQRNARTLAITATNHMATQAKNQTYKENNDIVIGYVIVATLDDRTSNECKGWDGTEVMNSDTFKPMPPFHPNCRTTTAPLLNDKFDFLDEGSTRASKGAEGGKQVQGDQTYYSWIKSQPASFQDEALGPERGKIFRNAGLTPEEFRAASRDRLGQPLTIDEMAKKDKRIAEYIS
jgi:SPP1 gp7 family putative phage head morphogenesis protein